MKILNKTVVKITHFTVEYQGKEYQVQHDSQPMPLEPEWIVEEDETGNSVDDETTNKIVDFCFNKL